MRKEKALIALLPGLVSLVAEESAQNPEFAAKIERLLSDLPAKKRPLKNPAAKNKSPEQLPDIYAEWSSRGETDFRLWMRDQPVPILRAIIRGQDFDPQRRTNKWKEAEKLADFITDGLRARLSRGFAFIGRDEKV